MGIPRNDVGYSRTSDLQFCQDFNYVCFPPQERQHQQFAFFAVAYFLFNYLKKENFSPYFFQKWPYYDLDQPCKNYPF